GGRFLIDVINRDYVIDQMPTRTWWEGSGCIFLEESEFDYGTSVLHAKRSFIYEDGSPPLEQNCYIRLYTMHELRQMLHVAGFSVLEISGERHHRGYYLGASSSRNIILAEKRSKG
ncbi:MAG: SAM-dependent methyltransferase, partial [Bradymonadaceae bacterium]